MSGLHVDVDAKGHVVRTTPGVDTFALPGLANAHSHAFQRALRGRVEVRSAEHDDFWSWRTAMYADAAKLATSPDGLVHLEALATWAYADLVRGGCVAVGEFHYLHEPAGASLAIARAAQRVGVQLVLLQTAYFRGGHGRDLSEAQQRFSHGDVEKFLAHVRATADEIAGLGAQTGLAIHSVRAVARGDIERIAQAARDDRSVLHVHACEQTREVDECVAEHGMTPIALLHACGALGPRTTVVHATHLTDADVELLASSGATVCLTPSTERNLGDGLCRIADLHARGVPLCVGTDSHARTDLVDELRGVEEQERLRLRRRNVLTAPGDRLAGALIPIGSAHGLRALGLESGRARVLVAMPLEGRAGDPAAGVDAWLVAGTGHDVIDVDGIDGTPLVRNGTLKRVADVEAGALAALKALTP